ncbi:Ribosome-inactivating protein [Cordyceps militaris CM01]|uniref:rRNA N-glycosylase n=2 Tax=Cordyceps militaris TaxID=73501 RepID=G3JUQ6_CORMM|nr:Ribosome-inactivating protein [Cordyceps militaris CM01]ATY59314.1 type 1 ribosome-inactivating musarmin 1 [Cordyceps militaris]EGX87856.1 Ribosome-inactivating protein [Cordyceps militaris CM01]
MLVRCLWLALAVLVSTAHGIPTPSELQPRGEKIPPRSVNLDEMDADAYKKLLEDLRGELEACRRPVALHVLPPQTPNPTAATVDWFDLGLHTGGFTITVRLQADNLYLLAYRVEGFANPEWRALADAGPLVPGSRALPGGFTYSRLETQADLRRPELPLGLGAFRGAASYLATHLQDPRNQDEKKALAKSLLVLVQMLSEALRFRVIGDHVAAEGAQITERMARLENDWADISEAVLRGDTTYTDSTPLLANENQLQKWELRTLAAAIAILGIALQPSLKPGPSGRLMTMAAREDQCGATPQGRTLLAVYFVRINDIDGEDPGDLYGSITATDALGTDTLWKQDPSYSIKPGQDVPLTGPSRPISGSGAFSIDLDLWDHDAFPDPSPDDQVAVGSVQWNPEDPSNQYDTTHYQQISGEHGSASVQYAVLRRALTARVQVILAKGDENPDDVCGTVTAITRLGKVLLFDVPCEKDKTTPVKENEAVPLRRSVLAVSLDDRLTIEAHLWDWDQFSPNDELANGSEAFAPKSDTKKTISGSSGRVDVNVEWIEL